MSSSSSSSTSMRRYHSNNDERDIDSAGVHDSERQCKTQPCRTISNRLQQLRVLGDINVTICHGSSTLSGEALAEEELVERLKQTINEFMTRPDRRYSYDTTLRWTVDHGNEINYSVVIYINQPANLF
ncbi:unnamed protein product [Adineta ricciae]|uniref:Uncharacterized protein n=1 Tax=Adineta ricciae TaxID=249248 RepID=A0A816AKU0_ADIRI|nr:unnamed protein product [Adineta ricciae]CAF1598833.1 unnamed protein product [Adineta ricciae]